MSRYDETEKAQDQMRAAAGRAHIEAVEADYSDIIVIPDVITIKDVCEIALDTTKGPQRVGDVCSREEIVHILRAFKDNPCSDPVLVAQYTLDEYRQNKNNEE